MPNLQQESLQREFIQSVENGTISSDIKKLVRRAVQVADSDKASKVDTPIDLNDIKDQNGHTMLHHLSKSGPANLVERMLNFGADPTIKDKSGKTALDYAAQSGKQDIIDPLLEKATRIIEERQRAYAARETAAPRPKTPQVDPLREKREREFKVREESAKAAAKARAEAAQKIKERQRAEQAAAKARAEAAKAAEAFARVEAARVAKEVEQAKVFGGMIERSEQRIDEELKRSEKASSRSFFSKIAGIVNEFFGRTSSKKPPKNIEVGENSSFSPLNSVRKTSPENLAHTTARAKIAAKAMKESLEPPIETRTDPMYTNPRLQRQKQSSRPR